MYNLGQIVRYDKDGPTALMLISSISVDHAGPGLHLYHGSQFYDGAMGAYHDQCSLPSVQDAELWEQHHRAKR